MVSPSSFTKPPNWGVYLYIMGFGKRQPIYQLGYATAIGVMMLLLIVAVSIVVRRLMKRESLQY